MKRTILGVRIRERRRALGITQADLARRLEISASYLNLIEHNKRAIAGDLLRRAAEALDLQLEDLDGALERRLLATLEEIAHLPVMEPLEVEAQSVGEFIGRYPGWARAVAALARAQRDADEIARALADRLTHDPFLGETVHKMLSQISAIRSAAEILEQYPDIDVDRRGAFVGVVRDESHQLSSLGEALAAYFDRTSVATRTLTPQDDVEAMLEAQHNRVDELESAVSGTNLPVPDGAGLARYANAEAMAEEHFGKLFEALLATHTELATSVAKQRARTVFRRYAAGSILAPEERFAPVAAHYRYDVEALANHFDMTFALVCERLCALSNEDGVPEFGYLRANAAGSVVAARHIGGLTAPRYAAACPLWVLFRAQQVPESVVRQRVLFPDGNRFVFVARAGLSGPVGFGRARHYLTDMLIMSEEAAALTVYAPDSFVPVEPVGSACRSCARRDCAHRVSDPLGAERPMQALPAAAQG